MMNTKIVYVLVSDESDYYYEQVMLSIRSLINNNPDARIEVLVDNATYATLKGNREVIKKYADVIEIDTPAEFDKMRRSRYLKTNMRNLVAGDFLFLDCDTIICESIEEIDKLDVNLGMVADLNGPLLLDDDNAINKCIKAGIPGVKGKPYFNSGVIFVKDSDMNRRFFNAWYQNYLKSELNGVFYDQPALCQTNVEFGDMISEMPGIWNCQFKMKGFPYLKKSKVMHYYANNGNNKIPFHIKEIFDRVKRLGDVDEHVMRFLRKPRTVLYSLFDMNPDKAIDYFSSDMVYYYYVHPRLFRLVLSILLKY